MATATCIAASEPVTTAPERHPTGQNLRELALPLRLMLSTGTSVAIATVVSARPRPAAARDGAGDQRIRPNHRVQPGWPLDRAIRDLAAEVLATGHHRLASLEIDADAASYIGLSGAASLDLLAIRVQAGDPVFAHALRYLDSGEATVLVIGACGSPGHAVVGASRVVGRLGWPELPATVVADARSLLGTHGTMHKSYGRHGERDGTGTEVWMQSYPAA